MRQRSFLIARVRGVPMFMHWSLPLVLLAFMLVAFRREWPAGLAAIASYATIMTIHELGHQFAARTRHCDVIAIELYPFHARCLTSQPSNAFDEAVIAWGGVLAQFVVAIPFAIYGANFGFTSLAPIGIIIAMFGAYNPVVAFWNLLPIPGFDGVKAWTLIPTLRRRARRPRAKSAQEIFDEAVREARRR